ncbi:GAF domain-containing protein [Pleurocapsales cyanobacterium LEGE 10410]|nr:GAF domain-containing protein [Pleurocapsales cyanobacterium LEGE 10410]
MSNHQSQTEDRQRTRLESETTAAERAKVTATIIDRIRRSHDIDTIFKVTTQETRRVLQCDRLIIYQFNSDWSGQAVAESVASGWSSLLVKEREPMEGDGHVQLDRCLIRDWSQGDSADIIQPDTFLQATKGGKYAHGQKFTAVDNIYTQGFPDCYVHSLEKYQAKAYLIAPIFQGKKLWGLLGAYQNDGYRSWQNSETELLVQIASQLAVALQQAEYVNQLKLQKKDLETTIQELKLAQQQLIQQEKLAALGQLIAGVAHEINTPLGAIQASAGNNFKAFTTAIAELPKLPAYLNLEERHTFFQLIERALVGRPIFSSSEKRPLKRQIAKQLKEHQIDNARNIADLLIDIGISDRIDPYLPLLRHSQVDWILDLAYNLTRLLINNKTIIVSVEKAAKVVFALKNYARFDTSGDKQLAQIQDGLETVLEIYHNKLKHSVEVVRNYQELPDIWCYADELIQVWTNLIHNSIQAMQNGGTLTLSTALKNQGIVVEIGDSGCGIPANLKEKIFEAFFTTKPTGEGSGLGLHICQKIIDKHQGTITVDSQPGKTKFTVWLPIQDR